MEDFQALFKKFQQIKVGVIGDVMLDTYMWGSVERISPEAPVPIVSLQKKEQRIGGAGNVALNLQSLGAKAYVISVTGDDEDAQKLNALFEENKIDTKYSVASTKRMTTNKTRVICRNQQMMRLDAEITADLIMEEEQILLDRFESFIAKEKPHIVVLSICKQAGVLTAVDPKRKNFFEYEGADLFKPNLKEVKEALNLLFTEADYTLLKNIHLQLQHLLHHKVSFITLSDKGVFYANGQSGIIPSHLRNIADVSGAGDTVIAVAALVYAATQNIFLMAEIANIAGGMVCEEVGTAAVDAHKLLHECELLLC
ncbi:MAG: bifunctional heptose 7-phosphate kinase/heptose 1-phosphate adenyltransferase [Chitinophagaceae bacterium]